MKKAAKKLTKRTKRILRNARKKKITRRRAKKIAVDFKSNFPSVTPTFVAQLQVCAGQGPTVQVPDPLWHWKTKAGTVLRITDMELSHLINAQSLLARRILHWQALSKNMKTVIQSKMREEGHDSQFSFTDETW